MPRERGRGRGQEQGQGQGRGRGRGRGHEQGQGHDQGRKHGRRQGHERTDPPRAPIADDDQPPLPFPVDDALIKYALLLAWLFYVDPSCDASRVTGKFLQQTVILWFAENRGFPGTEQLNGFRDTLTSTLTRHVKIVVSHQSEWSCDWLIASLLSLAGLLGAKSLDASMPTPLARRGITPHNILQFLQNINVRSIATIDLPKPTMKSSDRTNLLVLSFVHPDNFIAWLYSPPKQGDEQKRERYQKEHCKILCRYGSHERAYEIWKDTHLAKLESKYRDFFDIPSDVDTKTRLKECESLPQFLEQFRPHVDGKLFETVSQMHPDVLKSVAFTARDNFCRLLPHDFTLMGLGCPRVRKNAPKGSMRVVFDVRKACFRSLALAMHLSGTQFPGILDWLELDITILWEQLCITVMPEHPEFAFSKEWRQKVVNLIATNLRFVGLIPVFNQFILEMCAHALGTCCESFKTCDSACVILPYHLTIEDALAFPIRWFGRFAHISDFIKIDPGTNAPNETKNSLTRKAQVRNALKQTKDRGARINWNMLPETVRNQWKELAFEAKQLWTNAAAMLIGNPSLVTKERLHAWKTGPIPDIHTPSAFISMFVPVKAVV